MLFKEGIFVMLFVTLSCAVTLDRRRQLEGVRKPTGSLGVSSGGGISPMCAWQRQYSNAQPKKTVASGLTQHCDPTVR